MFNELVFSIVFFVNLEMKKNNAKVNYERCILLFALALYVLMDDGFFIYRFWAIGGENCFTVMSVIQKTVFLFEYICAICVIVILVYNPKFRYFITLLLLSVLVLIDQCCFYVYGRPADVFNISVLIDSAANVNDAARFYLKNIIKAIGIVALCFVPFFVIWYRNKKTGGNSISGKYLILFIFALCFIYISTIIYRGGAAVIGFPKGFSFGMGTVAVSINRLFSKNEKKTTDNFNVFADINNVILIVDESISYIKIEERISGNSKFKNNSFYNFGKTISAGNCSATSNYIMRKGVLEFVGGDCVLKEVKSLFEIAKENMWKTYYIDAQGVLKDRTVRNYFTDREINSIDKYVDLTYFDIPFRDRQIPKEIEKIISNNKEKTFIFINKAGIHFPYDQALERDDVDKEKMINYDRALSKNVIDVLEKLAKNVDDRTVIFYTSDHGQNFAGGATHCNVGQDVHKEEFYVPFYVITKNNYIKNKISEYKLNKYMTHGFISESIRNLLGEETAKTDSLFKNEEAGCLCGIYGQPIKFFGGKLGCVPF